jgi:hypothetical protein
LHAGLDYNAVCIVQYFSTGCADPCLLETGIAQKVDTDLVLSLFDGPQDHFLHPLQASVIDETFKDAVLNRRPEVL